MSNEFAKLLKDTIKKSSKTTKQICDIVGISEGYLTKMLYGARSFPKEMFDKITDALELSAVEYDELFISYATTLDSITICPEDILWSDVLQMYINKNLKGEY